MTPLPVGEIRPKHELFDYECKYTPGMAEEIFPAHSSRAWRANCRSGAARSPRPEAGGVQPHRLPLSAEGDIFFLEANTLPGMTPTSLIPQAGSGGGDRVSRLCERSAGSLARPGVGAGDNGSDGPASPFFVTRWVRRLLVANGIVYLLPAHGLHGPVVRGDLRVHAVGRAGDTRGAC